VLIAGPALAAHRGDGLARGALRLAGVDADEGLPEESRNGVGRPRPRSQGCGVYQVIQSRIAVGSGEIWGKRGNQGISDPVALPSRPPYGLHFFRFR